MRTSLKIYYMKTVMLMVCMLISISVYANTEWQADSTLISHSEWNDIAVGDFNTDGIKDIVAANPYGDEEYSPCSGLPVWIGSSVEYGNRRHWKLSESYEPTGWSPNPPQPTVSVPDSTHLSCIYNGNSGNMMAQWEVSVFDKTSVQRVVTLEGSSVCSFEIIDSPDYQWWYSSSPVSYTFKWNGALFSIRSDAYGSFGATASLDTQFTSDRGELSGIISLVSGMLYPNDEILVVIQPIRFQVIGDYHSSDGDVVLSYYHGGTSSDSWFYLGESAIDVLKWFKLSIDGGMPGLEPIDISDTWTFTSPGGPYTDKSYIDVEIADMNLDGQEDLIACGGHGIDLFLQTGPTISPIGFYAGHHDLANCNYWNPQQPDIQLMEENETTIKDERWTMTYNQNNGNWAIYGDLSGSQGNYDPYGPDYLLPCGQWEIKGVDGTYCQDDTFRFSTYRVNWSEDLGPETSSSYNSIGIGDINQDGKQDVVAAKTDGGMDIFYYVISKNERGWVSGTAPAFNGVISDLKVQDLNQDGRLDLAVASPNRSLHVWIGQSGATWSDDLGPDTNLSFESLALEDYNKDGLIDIAATSTDKSVHLFYLRQDATWFQRSKASVPQPEPFNEGNGAVSSVKVSNTATKTETWGLECSQTEPVCKFDVRGDKSGLQQGLAVVGELYQSDDGEIEFTIYAGSKDFALGDKFTFTTGRGPLSYIHFSDVDAADLDNDGNKDLFAASTQNSGMRVWRGNGVYGWTADTAPQNTGNWRTIYSADDLNFDGNPDIIGGSDAGEGIRVYIGSDIDKFGWTGWSYNAIESGEFNKITSADLNLDGKLDLLAANKETTRPGIWIWEGDNLGGFEVRDHPTDKSNYYSVATADFNLDGLKDIAAGHSSDGFDVWHNEKNWSWSISNSSVINGSFWGLTAVDVNHDGAPDLLAARNYDAGKTGIMVYYNHNNGSFSDTMSKNLSNAEFNYGDVDFADFNRDGNIDIIAAKKAGTPGLEAWFQDDNGDFPWYYFLADPSGWDQYFGLSAADYNLDSKRDFVIGSDGTGILAGFSRGHFDYGKRCMFDVSVFVNVYTIREIASGDLTNDGTPDIAVATQGNGILIYRSALNGPGSSSFQPLTQPTTSGDYVGVEIADFTSDGLPDVIGASEGSGVSGVGLWVSARDFSMVSIKSTYPGNQGTFYVQQDTVINIQFSKEIDTSTLTYENVRLEQDGQPIAYSLFAEPDGRNVRVTPINLERNVEYEVTIRGGLEGIRDQFGNQFDGNGDSNPQETPTDDYKFSFNTTDIVPPSIPTGVIGEPIDHGVVLSWSANDDPFIDSDIAGYWVFWNYPGTGNWGETYYPKAQFGLSPTYTIRGLDNEIPAIFRIGAMDADDNFSGYSEKIEVTPVSQKPQIWWAGWYNTDITSQNGGKMTLMAYVQDKQVNLGTESIQEVRLHYLGEPTNLLLYDDGQHGDFGANDSIFAVTANIGPGTSPLRVSIELVAKDSSGHTSYTWPYVHILDDIPGGSASSDYERYFRAQERKFLMETALTFEPAPIPGVSRPQVWLAGYAKNPVADWEQGPRHCLTAIVMDPDGLQDINEVELYFAGMPTGIYLANDGEHEDIAPNDAVFGFDLTMNGAWNREEFKWRDSGFLPVGPLMLEVRATDYNGNKSDIWPYFTVN